MSLDLTTPPKILYLSFNQDYSCLNCGTDQGFIIYNTNPAKVRYHRNFGGGIGIVEVLKTSNILILVGGGDHPKYPVNKLVIWDDYQDKVITDVQTNYKILGVKFNDNGTFNVTLPVTNVDVCFRLLNGRDEKTFLNGMQADKKTKNEKNITRQIAAIIVSLNEDSSIQAKQYFIDNVPSLDSRHLRLAYRLAAPNIDLTQQFECSECGHEQEMEVPLSADFFWSN